MVIPFENTMKSTKNHKKSQKNIFCELWPQLRQTMTTCGLPYRVGKKYGTTLKIHPLVEKVPFEFGLNIFITERADKYCKS